eukprot:GHUV01028186.1.p3 GENE.GHUV01028186.1~~GHUV01028186.1.p3  ORF type:complete len:125 (+),score=7.77 GHUV01028186.1:1170-1544(+)
MCLVFSASMLMLCIRRLLPQGKAPRVRQHLSLACWCKKPQYGYPALHMKHRYTVVVEPLLHSEAAPYLFLVALNAMYSSSLLAPAVSGVSTDDPPPMNTATQVLGPDASRAAAFTPPWRSPVCE